MRNDKFKDAWSSLLSSNGSTPPTAATNIFLWWYFKDSTKYSKLYDSNNWKTAYKEIYGYMGNVGDSITTSKLNSAYMTYLFVKRGYSGSVDLDESVSNSDITNATSPFHYCVYGHYLYKNHSLVGVGYNLIK